MTILYNGISLPEDWPPQDVDFTDSQVKTIPYLKNPPGIINVDRGRQLFFDDFLVDRDGTTAGRSYHYPRKYSGNPIFFPQTELELNTKNHAPCAICKCGGIQFDKRDKLFKMWYMSGYCGNMCYAESEDGVHWERPELDIVKGTNLCLPERIRPDSGSVIIDDGCSDESERFKMLLREGNTDSSDEFGMLMVSADGKHWSEPRFSGKMHDRSTMFYNPFTGKWVQSLRWWDNYARRCRYYYEHEDFWESGNFDWQKRKPVPWLCCDDLDRGVENLPQVYNFDAMAYESVMLGFFQIFRGPENGVSHKNKMPKLTELNIGYSRDGFHFHRPDRTAFIGVDRRHGSWEYGYIESFSGCCQTIGDELWFYYGAYAGDSSRTHEVWTDSGMYANGAVGLAKMRRDGFCSIDFRFPGACLTTQTICFSKEKLFVNAQTSGALLKVEALDADMQSIEGFSADECHGFRGNSVSAQITWKNVSLAQLKKQPVRFRFNMDRGELYSFEIK